MSVAATIAGSSMIATLAGSRNAAAELSAAHTTAPAPQNAVTCRMTLRNVGSARRAFQVAMRSRSPPVERPRATMNISGRLVANEPRHAAPNTANPGAARISAKRGSPVATAIAKALAMPLRIPSPM